MNFKKEIEKANRFRSKPLEITFLRGLSVESRHKAHAVVSDLKGRVLMFAGNAHLETFNNSIQQYILQKRLKRNIIPFLHGQIQFFHFSVLPINKSYN